MENFKRKISTICLISGILGGLIGIMDCEVARNLCNTSSDQLICYKNFGFIRYAAESLGGFILFYGIVFLISKWAQSFNEKYRA